MPTPEEAPAWAKGIPLERLREITALFREHDGDLPLSLATKLMERSVADALAAGKLRLKLDALGRPSAAIIASRYSRPQPIRDFSGWAAGTAPKGAGMVSRLACLPGSQGALLSLLEGFQEEWASSGLVKAPLWLRGWQEHPVDRWAAEELGLSWAGAKIAASSEIFGLWTDGPFQPCPPLELLGLARLHLGVPEELLERCREELALAPGAGSFQQHYSSYNLKGSWTALSLRAYGPPGEALSEEIVKPAEMSRKWKQENPEKLDWECQDTPMMRELPAIRELMNEVPGEKQRVRLMRLEPGGGELTRHADITDPEAGAGLGKELRIHAPIITNPDVRFRSWRLDGSQQEENFREGELWYLDTRKPHTAKNGGASPRVHLVMDVFSNPDLLALLRGEGRAE